MSQELTDAEWLRSLIEGYVGVDLPAESSACIWLDNDIVARMRSIAAKLERGTVLKYPAILEWDDNAGEWLAASDVEMSVLIGSEGDARKAIGCDPTHGTPVFVTVTITPAGPGGGQE